MKGSAMPVLLSLSIDPSDEVHLSDLISFVEKAKTIGAHRSETVSIVQDGAGTSLVLEVTEPEPVATPREAVDTTGHETWSSSDPDELRKELEYENKPVSLAYLCESLEWPVSRLKRAWHDLVVAGPSERYEIVRGPSGEGVSYALVRPASKPTRCTATWPNVDGGHVHRCRYGTMSNFAHDSRDHMCDTCTSIRSIEGN